MNVFIKSVVLLFFVRAGAIEELTGNRDFSEVENGTEWNADGMEHVGNHEGFGNKMNSTVHMSVNHYYCADEDIKDTIVILYGTKSWTFPAQDVNLTLSYPSPNSDFEFSSEDDGYIITGFKVVLYVDGIKTKGYIMEGGVLQESIVLSFVSSNITSLSYEFWLYGITKHSHETYIEMNVRYFACK